MSFLAYDKNSDYSYTFGTYPTIELLKNKPGSVIKIFARSKFYDSEGFRIVRKLAKEAKITIEQSEKLVQKLSTKENCFVVAAFKKYECSLDANGNHLVLVNPKDTGNLGTITRGMLAFDLLNLAIIKPSVDIFNPETIRASMGALFSLNFQFFESMEDYRKSFSERSFYPFITTGSEVLSKIQFKDPYSLIFGNESSGLDDYYKKLGSSVQISQSKKVDSLNLAVSVGIALHHIYEKYEK